MNICDRDWNQTVSPKMGQCVELHPGCDRWMMGDRFGKIVGFGKTTIRGKLDKSGKTFSFPPDRLRVERAPLHNIPGTFCEWCGWEFQDTSKVCTCRD